jgi:hypothetical protein
MNLINENIELTEDDSIYFNLIHTNKLECFVKFNYKYTKNNNPLFEIIDIKTNNDLELRDIKIGDYLYSTWLNNKNFNLDNNYSIDFNYLISSNREKCVRKNYNDLHTNTNKLTQVNSEYIKYYLLKKKLEKKLNEVNEKLNELKK